MPTARRKRHPRAQSPPEPESDYAVEGGLINDQSGQATERLRQDRAARKRRHQQTTRFWQKTE